MKYLLGTDTGSTMAKAALFDLEGREVACAGRKLEVFSPHPGWREVEPEQLWQSTAQAIREVITTSGVKPGDILAMGTSGAGDGGYYLDAEGVPLRRAIQSSDGRAAELARELKEAGVNDRVRALHGTPVGPMRTTGLGLWLKRHEPEVYSRIGHVAVTKDYTKFRLTGEWNSDVTDACSPGFVDLEHLRYSKELLEAVGVPELWASLSPFTESWEVMGKVTPEAAKLTGLAAGTPVVSGLHDVEACALGSGAITPGELVIIAGTWNINLVLVPESFRHPELIARRTAVPDVRFIGAIGATSAANLDWFVTRCCGDERAEAAAAGVSVYQPINASVANLPPQGIDLIYHPFLHIHGQNLPEHARAGFYGISGWHTKAHLLRALYEGVVFSHLHAIRQLPELDITIRLGHLTGGAAKSSVWSQMFADVLNLDITVVEAQEVGALGAALCAGIGAGVYKGYAEAVARAVLVAGRHTADAGAASIYQERYSVNCDLIDAMVGPWTRLAALRKS